MMKCYMNTCINQNEWACAYREDCDDCFKDCKHYYKCSSCDYYIDSSVEKEFLNEEIGECKIEVKIKFPSQYLEQYLLGKISLEDACDKTTKEVERLIVEYIKNNEV